MVQQRLKYTVAAMQIITEILKSAIGESPNWLRLETKAEELRNLAARAQVATHPGSNQYPGDGDGNPAENPGR